MGWKLFLQSWQGVQYTLAATCCILAGCSNATLTERNQSVALNPPTGHIPTSVSELTRHEKPFEGSLPLGLGARVNVFMAETAQGVGSLYSDVLKPMRTGKLFRSQPYAIDYAVRDRGDTFSGSSKLSGLDFRSSYDIRFGMSRRFANFGDFLKPGFWLAADEFGPGPPKGEMPAASGWNPLFIGPSEQAPIFQQTRSESDADLIDLIE